LNNSFKLGLTACALFVAASAAASAADLGHGTNGVNAVVTQSTCGALSPSLKTGSTTLSNILYPGPGKKATLVSPGTTSTSKPGTASTSVCVAKTATPSSGLNGATVSFACYGDTDSGPAKSPQATIKAKFKIGASHAVGVEQLTVTSSLYIGTSATPTCTFTTDGTAVLE
jgi:hypothetical protein